MKDHKKNYTAGWPDECFGKLIMMLTLGILHTKYCHFLSLSTFVYDDYELVRILQLVKRCICEVRQDMRRDLTNPDALAISIQTDIIPVCDLTFTFFVLFFMDKYCSLFKIEPRILFVCLFVSSHLFRSD